MEHEEHCMQANERALDRELYERIAWEHYSGPDPCPDHMSHRRHGTCGGQRPGDLGGHGHHAPANGEQNGTPPPAPSWTDNLRADLARYGLSPEEETKVVAEMATMERIYAAVNLAPPPPPAGPVVRKPWWRR
jgi:hypothetical protein